MKIDADIDKLAGLFPAYIAVDAVLAITAVGPAVKRFLPESAIGASIFEHFENASQMFAEYSSGYLKENSEIKLRARSNGAKLQGVVLSADTGFFLALRPSVDQFLSARSGLQISDFALDDPAVHGLLMFSLQRALLEDQRQVAVELAHERQKSIDLLNRISRIAGFISHDFNNFLSIIRLNCDRLAREDNMTARSLRLINIIKETSARGSAITRSFMTLSHQRDDTRVPTNIDDLIRENLAFFSTIVGSRISLEDSLKSGASQVIVSPVAALHCIINLLINARDAIAEGGTISISTRITRTTLHAEMDNALEIDDFIAIEVADTGCGMDDEILSRAFEPLFSTKANGNGLGLASVLEFARVTGGDACIESSEGGGTRVYLYLPVMPSPLEQTAWPSDDRTGQSTMPSKRILLVDDEPYALEALSELLEFEGYQVTPCVSAADALAELKVGSYEVLLTDIVMPQQGGIDLARSAVTLQPGIKIILMSGYVPLGEDLEETWMFIRKPLATKHLIELLRISPSSRR